MGVGMRMRAPLEPDDTTLVATHDEADRHTHEFGAERGRAMRAPPMRASPEWATSAATELGAGHPGRARWPGGWARLAGSWQGERAQASDQGLGRPRVVARAGLGGWAPRQAPTQGLVTHQVEAGWPGCPSMGRWLDRWWPVTRAGGQGQVASTRAHAQSWGEKAESVSGSAGELAQPSLTPKPI